jgi:hypothetical protein
MMYDVSDPTKGTYEVHVIIMTGAFRPSVQCTVVYPCAVSPVPNLMDIKVHMCELVEGILCGTLIFSLAPSFGVCLMRSTYSMFCS